MYVKTVELGARQEHQKSGVVASVQVINFEVTHVVNKIIGD